MEGIYAYADQIKVYKAILDATQEIQKWLRYHSGKFLFIYLLTLIQFISSHKEMNLESHRVILILKLIKLFSSISKLLVLYLLLLLKKVQKSMRFLKMVLTLSPSTLSMEAQSLTVTFQSVQFTEFGKQKIQKTILEDSQLVLHLLFMVLEQLSIFIMHKVIKLRSLL